MKKEINDLLLKMQSGENCIGETANKLLDLLVVSNSSPSFEQYLREEFLLNTQNYPKEYHQLVQEKFKRAEKRFKEQSDNNHLKIAAVNGELHIPTKEEIIQALYKCAKIEQTNEGVKMERLFEKEAEEILLLLICNYH